MVTRARTICRQGGCGQLVDVSGYCPRHTALRHKEIDERRGSAAERGYGHRWRKARATFLAREPLCVECAKVDRDRAATVVDHIIPHRLKEAIDSCDDVRIAKASDLFWDSSNWQSLCKPHHDLKTAREDGGFGRVK